MSSTVHSDARIAPGAKSGRRLTAGQPSLKERAYAAIKHRIITCAFPPGGSLNEAVVAAELQLGRTPVNQAFDRLAREGLVDVIPRRGVIVRPLRLDEIIQVVEARLLNEAYAVRLAAERASPAEIVALRDVLARAEAAAEEDDSDTSMLLDGEFHALIAEAAKNSILADILLNLNERSLRLWSISLSSPGHLAEVAAQHRAIFQAICHRDPAHAEVVMREHVDSFRRTVLRRL